MKLYKWALSAMAVSVARISLLAEPVFVTTPADVQVQEGVRVTLPSDATGALPVRYQWYHNGEAISGAIYPSLVVENVRTYHAGSYTVTARDQTGTVAEASATVEVEAVPIEVGGVDLGFFPEIPSDYGQPMVSFLQQDGKMVFTFFKAGPLRLLTDGRVDPSFRRGAVHGDPYMDREDRLLIWDFRESNLIRYRRDGSVDPEFAKVKTLRNPTILPLQGGKLLLSPPPIGVPGVLVRLNEDGSLDDTFQATDVISPASAMAEWGKDQVLLAIADSAPPGRVILLWLNQDGSLARQSPVEGSPGQVSHLRPVSGGRVLIQTMFHLHLVEQTGAIVASATSTHVPLVDRSGRVVVAGGSGVERLNADLSLESQLLEERLRPILLQADGKVLVRGSFTSLNGASRPGLARIHVDGDAGAPAFQLSPTPQAVHGNRAAAFNVAVSGNPYPEFQWYHEGEPIPGATNASFILSRVAPDQAGFYHVRAENEWGAVESERAELTVLPEMGPAGVFDPDFRFTISGAVFPMPAREGSYLEQPDGKILITGSFKWVNNIPQSLIARLNADGSLDGSFDAGPRDPNGFYGFRHPILDFAVQSDGKILVGGDFRTFAGHERSYLVRLLPDGSFDHSFADPKLRGAVGRIVIAPDQTILIAGKAGFQRLSPNGALLRGFRPAMGASDMIALPDERIVVSDGHRAAVLDVSGAVAVNGELPEFTAGVRSLVGVFPDESMLFDTPGAALQVLADGSPGNSFSYPFAANFGTGEVLPNGQVLFMQPYRAGSWPLQFNQDGEATTSFAANIRPNDRADGLRVLRNGDMLILDPTGFTLLDVRERMVQPLLRLRGMAAEVPSILEQPAPVEATSGVRVLLKAKVSAYPEADYQWFFNGVPIPGAASRALIIDSVTVENEGRYFLRASNRAGSTDSDTVMLTVAVPSSEPGSVDAGFVPSLARYSRVSKVLPVGRDFIALAEIGPSDQVVRLDGQGKGSAVLAKGTDGGRQWDLDRGWDRAKITEIAVQADGRILVGGDFRKLNGVPMPYLARLLPDGSFDPDFKPGAGPGRRPNPNRPEIPPVVHAIAIQPDGKLLIGGRLNMYDGKETGNLVRLHPNGTLDETFAPDPDLILYTDIWLINQIILSGDSIWVSGDFPALGETALPGVALFSSAGALLAEVVPEIPAGVVVDAIAAGPGSSLMVAGRNDAGAGFLTKLDADGKAMAGFAGGVIADGPIQSLAVLDDGSVVIGGRFSVVHGQPRSLAARLDRHGRVDRRFDSGQPQFTQPSSSDVLTLLPLADRLLVGGSFMEVNGFQRPGLAAVHLNVASQFQILNAEIVDGVIRIQTDRTDMDGLAVEAAGDVSSPVWVEIPSNSPVPGLLVVPISEEGRQFYRLRGSE